MRLKILFLILFLPSCAWGASIEIYAHGYKYESLAAYKASKEDGVHQLYLLSLEKGMTSALNDFDKPWALSPLAVRIRPNQMQQAIKQAVTISPAPKLLICESGKLRIMTWDEAQSPNFLLNKN